MQRFILPPTTLVTAGTTAVFIPGMLWRPANNIVLARVQWEIFDKIGTYPQCAPAYQATTNVDAPTLNTAVIIDTTRGYQSTVDVYYPSDFYNLRTNGTTPLKSNMLVRFGWLFNLVQGSSLSTIVAGGVVETTETS